jgi:hypothetical protein
MFVKKSYFILSVAMLFSACAHEAKPTIVPAVAVKPQVQPAQTAKKHPLGVIGAVEPIYFLPMKTPFSARVDTGAKTSSIDVSNMNFFERDEENWVSFDLVNKQSGEKHSFEKKVLKQNSIKRIDGSEERNIVMMDVKFGGKVMKVQFSLADRSKFDYQGLVGRNILTGLAVVDTSLSNTLK